jgi:hypothetical protein
MAYIKKKLKGWANRTEVGSQQGATLVEFALILFGFILLLFGIIEFSLFMFNKQVITNASREGARAGIVARPVRMNNADIKAVVLAYCKQYLVTFGTYTDPEVILKPEKPENIDMAHFNPTTHRCVTFGCILEVPVDFTYEFLFLKNIGISSKNIQSVAQMRME